MIIKPLRKRGGFFLARSYLTINCAKLLSTIGLPCTKKQNPKQSSDLWCNSSRFPWFIIEIHKKQSGLFFKWSSVGKPCTKNKIQKQSSDLWCKSSRFPWFKIEIHKKTIRIIFQMILMGETLHKKTEPEKIKRACCFWIIVFCGESRIISWSVGWEPYALS